jgi:hypothetical protein
MELIDQTGYRLGSGNCVTRRAIQHRLEHTWLAGGGHAQNPFADNVPNCAAGRRNPINGLF